MEAVLGPYERANNFHEGVAWVVSDGTQRYVDQSGKVLFENRWNSLGEACFEQRILFCRDGLFGFLNKRGQVVIRPVYQDVGLFSEGIAVVVHQERRYAIDSEGQVVFELDYEWLGPFREGLARFRRHGKYGYVDRQGIVTIENRFVWADDFSEGWAPVSDTGK